jgi:hypothetical protein
MAQLRLVRPMRHLVPILLLGTAVSTFTGRRIFGMVAAAALKRVAKRPVRSVRCSVLTQTASMRQEIDCKMLSNYS